MPARRRGSIRLWQTELFVAVIIVAILILSGSLSAGLKATLTRMTETSERRNASALAQRLASAFPLGVDGTASVRAAIAEYRDIYGGGIWVYDSEGELLASEFDAAPTDATIESALVWGLEENSAHVVSDLSTGGWVVASQPIESGGQPVAVVITASSADGPAAILRSVRDRMWVTFWISLLIAGLLGYGFSSLISNRIRAMSTAAAAIAAGDFDQRLHAGLVPDEIHDLAESYNTMAEQLGQAFGAVEDQRRQIAAVVESMAEGLVGVDHRGVVTVINAEALLLLGVEQQDATGQHIRTLTTEPAIVGVVERALSGERAIETVPLGDRVALVHCTPLPGESGDAEGAVLLLADVTDQHRAEAAQRRFVADASHELRTPIAALKGMLELLDDGAKNVPDVRDDFIHTMQLESDRLGRLVSDLLTLARLESGSLALELAPVYVADLLGDVAHVMQMLAAQADVTLAVEAPDEDLRALADRDRLVQVLLGFTDNALKHAPAGTTVSLSATAGTNAVTFSVCDQGPGISAEEIDRVFERFYRADSARRGAGTGLGLAIAKEIIEAHGSSIRVESAPGEGTCFSFVLPPA